MTTPNGRLSQEAIEALLQRFGDDDGGEPPDFGACRLNWRTLARKKPPERDWIWRDWIPARTTTLLHGPGGVGKSTFLQQLLTAVALGVPMLGSDPLGPHKVLAWFGEDDHDEIWRRQVAINRTLCPNALDESFARIAKRSREPASREPADTYGLLRLADRAAFHALPGEDISLFLAKSEGDYQEGPALTTLREQIGDLKPGLVVLDSLAKIYGGPENNRQLATRCIQRLIGLCIEFDTTIILNGHDNKLGEYSGTTAWENTVRSRLHFKRQNEVDEKDKPIKGGDTHNLLVRPKANYSAADEDGIAMKWFNGAFISLDPKQQTPEMQAATAKAEAEADRAFVDALRQLTVRQQSTSDAPSSPYYAPKQILNCGLANGCTSRQLEKAMRRLIMCKRTVPGAAGVG